MASIEFDENDDLKPEYDLSSLRVRRVGEGRLSNHVPLDENDDLLPHYDLDYLDYSKSKPNRFAEAYQKGVTIRIDGEESASKPAKSECETE